MTPAEVAAAQQSGAVLLDMRLPRVFAKAHVPGAVNLQFNRADLVDRADMALSREPAYLVHAEPEAIAKVAVDLMREAGFTILGHLEGGLAGWRAAGLPTGTITVISVDDLRAGRAAHSQPSMRAIASSSSTHTCRVRPGCPGPKRGPGPATLRTARWRSSVATKSAARSSPRSFAVTAATSGSSLAEWSIGTSGVSCGEGTTLTPNLQLQTAQKLNTTACSLSIPDDGLANSGNDRDDHDEHDTKHIDVAHVAAVVIVATSVSTVTLQAQEPPHFHPTGERRS